mgnify:CR=1 FL=1
MEKNDYTFSIIVPVYNTEKYVEKCLKSITEAIQEDCEVIIVNDGSTDNSKEKIIKFINNLPEKYKKNFIYTEKDNKGLADTKNVGLDLAHGEFISFVDSDDYISDDFYAIARKYINDYNVIIYDVYVIYENSPTSNYVSRAKTDWKVDYMAAVLNGAISGSSCNKIIKKDLYKGHKFPVGKQYEDTAVTPFILSETDKIKYVPYPMYYYLQREKSIVATNTFMSAYYKICNNISDVIKEKNGDMDRYKYVINEFVADRMLDMLSQDCRENKKEFLKNIQEMALKNKEVIRYILDSNMLNNVENHYSERQKQVVNKILVNLKESKYSKVKKILETRMFINKVRKVIK